MPERQLAGQPGRGRDEHPVVGDVLDPPARRAEGEDVADPRLVHHLLVELADPRALLADEEDAEQAAVGDGAAAGDRKPLRARPSGQGAGHAVPDQARPQLGELVAGVATGEHVEGGLEHRVGQRRRTARRVVRRWRGRRRSRCRARPSRRSAGRARRAAAGGSASTRSGRSPCARRRPRRAAGRRGTWGTSRRGSRRRPGGRPGRCAAARWRRSAATRPGSTRSTAPMSMPSSRLLVATTAGRSPRLSASSISLRCSRETLPWWARASSGGSTVRRAGLCHQLGRRAGQRATARAAIGLRVGGLGPLLGDLVEPRGQPLGQPPRVGEHDGRGVRLRPGRRCAPRPPARSRAWAALPGSGSPGSTVSGWSGSSGVPPGSAMSSTGTTTSTVIDLARRRLDDHDVACAAEEAGHLVDRAHGGREPEPLRPAAELVVEPLEAEREVGAALGRRDGVDLVDDDRLDPGERLAGSAGQQQEQRLRRGDQDVRRLRGEQPALVGRGVAGAHADGDVGHLADRAGSAACRMPASGARRLRSTSKASAFSGET